MFVRALIALAILSWLFVSIAYGQDPTASPTPFESVGDAVSGVVEGAKAVKAAGSLATWLALIVAILKSFWMVVERVPSLAARVKKWGVEINIVVPALIGIAYKLIGGGEWWEVVALIATGPLMGTMHDTATYIWKLKKKAGSSDASES